MKTLFTFLFMAGILACANTKTMNQKTSGQDNQETESDYFILSQGGGFTGAYETYLVQKDGKVYELKNESDRIYLGQLPAEITDSMFAILPDLGVTNQALSPAGNMNYALTTFFNDTKNTLTWADGVKPNKAIESFFSWAMAEVRKTRNQK